MLASASSTTITPHGLFVGLSVRPYPRPKSHLHLYVPPHTVTSMPPTLCPARTLTLTTIYLSHACYLVGRVLHGNFSAGRDSSGAQAARTASAFVSATCPQRAAERRVSGAIIRGSDRLPSAVWGTGVRELCRGSHAGGVQYLPLRMLL